MRLPPIRISRLKFTIRQSSDALETQGRMHDKYVIVDDSAYILGGRNTFDYFLGDYDSKNKSLDREVLIYNTAQGEENSGESSLFQVEAYLTGSGIWMCAVCSMTMKDSRKKKKGFRSRWNFLKPVTRSFGKSRKAFDTAYDYTAHTCAANRIRLVSGPIGIYGERTGYFLYPDGADETGTGAGGYPYAVCGDQ